jgi:predicted ATP-grasp superfamily ATP-dependent carboligase
MEPQTLRPPHASAAGKKNSLAPAIILGGRANALSVARSVGRLGAAVYILNDEGAFAGYSRYVRQIHVPSKNAISQARAWADFLLGPDADFLRGAVLLSCCDEGIELLIEHRDALAERYLLDEAYPPANATLLNKLATYQAAVEAGVPTPRFWIAQSSDQLTRVRDTLVYPLIIKPRLSHVFEGRTGKKLIVAHRFDEVTAAVDAVVATGTDCLLVEMIPGPDDRLCSYFTYLDADSKPSLHFTKRIIRRFPLLMGTGCYHVTDWIPELPELANRLFSHVKLRGLANAEFKHDLRDGQYKLIECNARFNASDCLVAASGVDLGAFVYNRLTGRPQRPITTYRRGLRIWDPIRDFQAGLEMRRRGESTFGQWLASVMHRQTFFYFRWTDPMPALARLTLPLRKKLSLTRKRDV